MLAILADLKAGQQDPGALSTADRRLCVQHLGTEGYAVPEIAQVLQTSDRTIYRDREKIRESEAIEHDPQLAGRVAGRLLAEAEVCITRIRRTTRDRETPPAVKVDGERAVFEIVNKATERLQSLGYLPSAAQRIEAALTHRLGEPASLEEISAEAKRLALIQDQVADPLTTPSPPAPSEADRSAATTTAPEGGAS